jgi:hypothetical protein
MSIPLVWLHDRCAARLVRRRSECTWVLTVMSHNRPSSLLDTFGFDLYGRLPSSGFGRTRVLKRRFRRSISRYCESPLSLVRHKTKDMHDH